MLSYPAHYNWKGDSFWTSDMLHKIDREFGIQCSLYLADTKLKWYTVINQKTPKSIKYALVAPVTLKEKYLKIGKNNLMWCKIQSYQRSPKAFYVSCPSLICNSSNRYKGQGTFMSEGDKTELE